MSAMILTYGMACFEQRINRHLQCADANAWAWSLQRYHQSSTYARASQRTRPRTRHAQTQTHPRNELTDVSCEQATKPISESGCSTSSVQTCNSNHKQVKMYTRAKHIETCARHTLETSCTSPLLHHRKTPPTHKLTLIGSPGMHAAQRACACAQNKLPIHWKPAQTCTCVVHKQNASCTSNTPARQHVVPS